MIAMLSLVFGLAVVRFTSQYTTTPSARQFAEDVAEAIRRKGTRARAAELFGVSEPMLDAQLTGRAHLSPRQVARLPEAVYHELLQIVTARQED